MTLHPAALALMLLGVQPPPTGADCAIGFGVLDVLGAPLPIERISSGTPVALAAGAVLASETVQIATRMWRAGEPISLPAYRFTYPVGTRVTALMSPRGGERCLRDALPRTARPPGGRDVVPCLVDADGDGRFEAADIATLNMIVPYAGTRPRFRPSRRIALGAPVSIAEDPQGIGPTRQRLHRRLRVVASGADSIEVAAEHGVQSAPALVEIPLGGGAPRPVEPGPIRWRTAGAARVVRLVDGGSERIGGVAFRFERGAGGGWSATPVDPAFPQWLEHRCGGTAMATLRIPL